MIIVVGMMMKKGFQLLCIVLILFSFSSAFAQDDEISSVLKAKDDSAKVIRLANLAYGMVDTDLSKAEKLYDELMRLSTQLNYPYWIAMVWINRGFINARLARDEAAIQNYFTALGYLKHTNRVDKIALCHLNIGNISERLGRVDDKIKHLSEAIRLLQNTQYHQLLNHVYNSMGVLFYNQDDFSKGLLYFEKAVQSSTVSRDTLNLCEALHGVVNCLSSQEKFETASGYGKEGLSLAIASGNKYNLLHAYTALAEMNRKWKKAAPTIENGKKIIACALAAGEVQYQLIGMMSVADGYALARDYSNSLIYYNRALELAKEKSAGIQLDDIYKGLSEDYEQLHAPAKALYFYKKFTAYKDSASNEKTRRNAAELDVKYQVAQKEKKISEEHLQLAQKDLLLQRNRSKMFYTACALGVAMLFVVMLFFRFKQKKRFHQKEIKALEQQKEIQLLQALMQGEEKERSRIAKDLHDGIAGMLAAVKMHFGSIPSADQLAKTVTYQQGMKLLDEAAMEIRKTSHNLMPELLQQYGLDEALCRFCASISNSISLEIQYDCWGEMVRFDDGFELSVYRIVQELINNIVKHSKATKAFVQLALQDDLLTISVEDNGIGFTTEETRDGMGLRSLQSRIKAMNGKLEVETSGRSGVCAYLEFDVSDLKKEIAVII